METPLATSALCHFCAGLDLRETIGRLLTQRKAALRNEDVEDVSTNGRNDGDHERPPESGGGNNPRELDDQGDLDDVEVAEEGAAINRDDDDGPGVVSLESPWLGLPL